MNNQYIGNSFSLMNYDLTIQLGKLFNTPLWYVPMLTVPRSKNKDDSNMTNYRLGSENLELFQLMNGLYSQGEADITEISAYLRGTGIDTKTAITPGNAKAGHYSIGSSPHFTHKERGHYFEGLTILIENAGQQIIFLDPDTGIAPINQEVSRTKGSSLILLSEIKRVLNKITDDSIIIIRQSMNNHFYNQDARIKDLHRELDANVIAVVDDVIQSGLFIVTKSEGISKAVVNKLQQYLSGYKAIKNGSRIHLGYNEGDEVIVKSITTFEPES